jgi:UDP-N-acetylglucosamine--N-acetylmuramyl-(pentapeptide) pyrophosphoryl-undecaprenol N-acetylglucosamine transferase
MKVGDASKQGYTVIVFAGGGTGGHLFPAIAIADEVRAQSSRADVNFVGTRHKIESRLVPEHGYPLYTIWISGFRRSISIDNLLFPVKVMVSLMQSFRLMRQLRPAVVVGTGGYVSGPVVYMASLLGIPTLLQEQNSYPGVTTRLLARRAREVHITFETTRRYLRPGTNIRLSGNPIRRAIGSVVRAEGLSRFSLTPDRPVLLVVGGSHGASSINRAIEQMLPGLIERGVQLIWQTGTVGYEHYASAAQRWGNVRVLKFIDSMEYAYAACDLAVCRAGATTVTELMCAGVPSVLVPYPFAAADHQTENARALVDTGAAVMVKDANVSSELAPAVHGLLADAARRQEMAVRARARARPDAAATIARSVLALAGQ